MIAAVAVEGLPFFSGGRYDYALPQELCGRVQVGSRVVVPFGRDRRAGFILSLSETTDYPGRLRAVASVAEDALTVPEELIALALTLSEQTLTPVYETLKAMLPAGLALKTEAYYLPGEISDAPDGLAAEIAAAVRAKEKMSEKALLSLFGESAKPLLSRLTESGVLIKSHVDKRSLGDHTVPTVFLNASEDALERYVSGKIDERAATALSYLARVGECDKTELCYMSGVTPAMLQTLKKHTLIGFGKREVLRVPEAEKTALAPQPLSPEQRKVAGEIGEAMEEFRVHLLYGVTGSGKTHIFYHLIEKTLAAGRSVIVMVPEIMLAVQMTARLKARYGDKVAVMHSDLSAGRRLDEWKRMQAGEAMIAVGTRSAVFAPFQNIGLIVMDEEQEHTYKSELSPRYHARSVAMRRAAYHHCPLILASATPSLESRRNAEKGKYAYHRLTGRYNGTGAPPTKVVDMREELKAGVSSIYSRALQKELAENLARGEQSILFINRRGFNTFVSCRSCGTALTCPNCSIGLTYHIKNNRLMCHYCGYSAPVPEHCPECGSEHIRYFGTGTQKAELELQALFPTARILRMDADTTAGRDSHEACMKAFDKGEYDILLGTQMVTKGLDFPNVTLVGVLAADSSLYSDDYRAGERTFSLITQVIGRAGRAKKPGRALIQTYSPGHEILSLGVAQDYEGFYRHEISARKMLLYPPFSDLCQLLFAAEDAASASEAAERFKEALIEKMKEADLPMVGLGPAPCHIARLGGFTRYRLLIKCRASAAFRQVLRETLERFAGSKEFKKVRIDADINPYNIQ